MWVGGNGFLGGALELPFSLSQTCTSDKLQLDEVVTTIPTVGFNVETVQYRNVKFQVCFWLCLKS